MMMDLCSLDGHKRQIIFHRYSNLIDTDKFVEDVVENFSRSYVLRNSVMTELNDALTNKDVTKATFNRAYDATERIRDVGNAAADAASSQGDDPTLHEKWIDEFALKKTAFDEGRELMRRLKTLAKANEGLYCKYLVKARDALQNGEGARPTTTAGSC